MKLIDLTYMIEDQMAVYPGDSEVSLVQSNSLGRDGYCNHQLSINMHAGTHIDGPMHLTNSDTYMSDITLDAFIGKGIVLDVSAVSEIDYHESYEQLVPERCMLILYTGYGKHYGEDRYFSDHPVLTEAFARFIINKNIKMIGLDMPSPDHEPFTIHKLLFKHHILIAENLANVEQLLNDKSFEIIALPLLIQADSALARVIARVDE